MGDVDNRMAARYREGGIDEDQLIAVVNYVRQWLFSDPPAPGDETTAATSTAPETPEPMTNGDDAPALKFLQGKINSSAWVASAANRRHVRLRRACRFAADISSKESTHVRCVIRACVKGR